MNDDHRDCDEEEDRDDAGDDDDLVTKDPYEALEIEIGAESAEISQEQIKRQFRKLALKLHPDKRPNRERARAQREFERARKAYEILSNAETRARVDALIMVKRRRERELTRETTKRRKMRELLEKREIVGKRKTREEEEDSVKKEKLKMELENLREKYEHDRYRSDGVNGYGANDNNRVGKTTSTTTTKTKTTTTVDLERALKAAWRKPNNTVTDKDHDAPSLFKAFEKYNVCDVVFREIECTKKRKKKGSAFVICKTREDAIRASEAIEGIESEGGRPVIFVTLAKLTVVKEKEEVVHGENKVFPALTKTEDFEKDVLAKMRKAAEERRKVSKAAAVI